jgi:hypothetical protein
MAALSQTGKGEAASRETISKLKLRLTALRQELAKVERLVEIARPAKLPELKPALSAPSAAAKAGKFSGVMVGKRKGGGGVRILDPAVKEPPKPEAALRPEVEHILSAVDVKKESVKSVEDAAKPKKEAMKPEAEAAKPEAEAAKPEKEAKSAFKMDVHSGRKLAKPVSKPVRKPVSRPVDPFPADEEDVWVPPANQTGDGRTALNEKYGY